MSADDMLPIRRLTLYKHGVCFVRREGAVTGEEVRLRFRAAEVNDALKSVLAIDRGGGRVHGVYYDTPAGREDRLAECPIRLGDDHSLLDLLRGLRGWRVRLSTGTQASGRAYQGCLLGVDLIAPGADTPPDPAIAVQDEASGEIAVLRLADLASVTPLEERARQDLAFFLESSRVEEAHRDVVLRLSPGEHDLLVSYLVPSPTWRVSYRLVAETASGASPDGGGEDGDLLLQGWGLFDNRLEEDLREVEVSLVAGQPISFIYDLATSRIPHRPLVEDASRVAPGPVEFSEALRDAPAPAGASAFAGPEAPRMARARVSAPAPMAMAAPAPAVTIDSLAAQPPAATAEDLGELFAYQVLAPVSVRRGESALVPIIGARLPYKRELLFNERKLPAHPVAALRFANATGLVLERGPVTVLEDGEYRGEAVVPFSKDGAEVYLAFAVELGIAVRVERTASTEVAGLRIAGAVLDIKSAILTRTEYRIESSLATARTVTIEHPIDRQARLVDTPEPARTGDWYRWTVACAPRAATAFAVTQRRVTTRSEQVLDQSYDALQRYLRDRWLDRATYDRLAALLAERAAIAANEREGQELARERGQIYEREEQLRKNMAALSNAGDEGALRRQAVDALGRCEARIAAIDARLAALAEDSTRRRGAIDAELARLRLQRDSPDPGVPPEP